MTTISYKLLRFGKYWKHTIGNIEEYWKCLQCDHQVKRIKGKGWTNKRNLAQHATTKHDEERRLARCSGGIIP
jgi:hypothetical protein